jgi:predicted  nucleic acid-binding Zn-ribbon protein
VEAAKARLKDNHEARRALEKDAAMYQARVSKFKDQQSAVKTNKEYQAIQHETETAQRDVSAAEEKVLERMMEADAIAADIKQAESVLTAQEKEVGAVKADLAKELAVEQETLARASQQRESLLASLNPRLLALFEQVSRVRKGIAICSVTRDGLCSVCHVRLRPQVFQQVRQNDGTSTCWRILYYVRRQRPRAPSRTPCDGRFMTHRRSLALWRRIRHRARRRLTGQPGPPAMASESSGRRLDRRAEGIGNHYEQWRTAACWRRSRGRQQTTSSTFGCAPLTAAREADVREHASSIPSCNRSDRPQSRRGCVRFVTARAPREQP